MSFWAVICWETVAVPALIALLLHGVERGLRARGGAELPWRDWRLAGAWLMAYVWIRGFPWPAFWMAIHWLPCGVLGAAVLVLFPRFLSISAPVIRALLAALLLEVIALWMLPLVPRRVEILPAVLIVAGLVGAGLILAESLHFLIRPGARWYHRMLAITPFVATAAAQALALQILVAKTALAAVTAMALCDTVIARQPREPAPPTHGALPALLLLAVLLPGYLYGGLPGQSLISILAMPIAGPMALRWHAAGNRGWWLALGAQGLLGIAALAPVWENRNALQTL